LAVDAIKWEGLVFMSGMAWGAIFLKSYQVWARHKALKLTEEREGIIEVAPTVQPNFATRSTS